MTFDERLKKLAEIVNKMATLNAENRRLAKENWKLAKEVRLAQNKTASVWSKYSCGAAVVPE